MLFRVPHMTCLVYQFWPSTSFLRQYVSKLVIIHQHFPILLSQFGDRPSKDWKPCVVALSSYLPVRNTVPRIFEHVLPCRRTTQTFPILVIFQVLQQNTWFKHLIVLFNNCVIWFAVTLSASKVNVIKKWCRFLNVNVFRPFLPRRS